MITPDYVVEKLCQMMGNSKGMYGIEWSLDRENGYRAVVNGVGVYLANYEGHDPKLHLFLFKGGAIAKIVEPAMPLSRAPIGKFLRTVVGVDPWSKAPETLEAKAEEGSERLRIALHKLHGRASEQDDLRAASAFVSEELRAAITRGAFKKDFFATPGCDEAARQQLFREVLRLKQETM